MKWAVPTAALVVVGAAVALTARGQDQPPNGVRYYQGKVSPSVPGQAAGYSPAAPTANNRPPLSPSGVIQRAGATPPPAFSHPSARSPVPQYAVPSNVSNRTRFTQPVIAGADGVRQAGATEPGVPAFSPLPSSSAQPSTSTSAPLARPSLPPPNFGADAKMPTPRVLVEDNTPSAPTAAPLPDPKPLTFAGPTSAAQSVPPVVKPSAPVESLPPAVQSVAPVAPLPPVVKPEAPVESLPPVVKPAVVTPAPKFEMTLDPKPTSAGEPPPSPSPKAKVPAIREMTAALGNETPLSARQSPNVIIEVVAPESVGVGQPVTYELLVRNIGTTPVSSLRVEDEPPAKAEFLSSDPAAETVGSRLTWSLGNLDAGAERRIKVTVKPAEEGTLSSRAVMSFAASVESTVKVTRPRLSVVMTGPDVIRVGEKVPFQIKLSNTGSGPAGRVMLQAKFSDGLTHPSGQVIEAELANLPAGQTKSLTLEAIAGKSGGQSCVLTAAADGNPPETVKTSVSLVEPMLQVKQTGPAKCLVKSEPVFQIELTNPGTAATDPVHVWAGVPAGFEFVGTTDGGSYSEANRSVGWRLAGLPAGGSKTVTVKLRATAPAEGVVQTVAMTTPGDPVTPTGGVMQVEARVAKGLEARTESAIKSEGVPALRFEVVDIEDPIIVGTEAVYEVRVTNQGTGACTNVQIVADLAEGTTPTGATGPTTGCVTGQQIVFDPIPDFGVKAEAAYRVRVKGTQPGDRRFRVRLACDQIKNPVVKEENTRFYKE